MGLTSPSRWDHIVLLPDKFGFYTSVKKSAYEWWHVKNNHGRAYLFSIAALLMFFVFCLTTIFGRNGSACSARRKPCPCDLIVPDIIHFYRGEKELDKLTAKEATCVKAALRLHDQVWFHTTYPLKVTQALSSAGLDSSKLRVMYPPRGPGPVHLAILREYGGIFLKNDIYIVERLDTMRGHDFCSVGDDDIVAGTREGAIAGQKAKLKGILLDQDYGALYIRDIINNCTYSAVRLEKR